MLYEFQEKTIDKIVEEFKTKKTLILLGKKASGKSVVAMELKNYLKSSCVYYFTGEPSKQYIDFAALPLDIINNVNSMQLKKSIGENVIKDIAATLSPYIFNISIENTLDSVLTNIQKSEISNIIYYIIKLSKKENIYLIFDNVEWFDQKTMSLLYNIIDLNLKGKIYNIQILIILNKSENYEYISINKGLFEQLYKIDLMSPTDKDLSSLLQNKDYDIARDIPIKYLIELKKNAENFEVYYSKKLNDIIQDNINTKRLLYTLVLLDENVFLNDIIILLSDISIEEICQSAKILQSNSFLECNEINNDVLYSIPQFIKSFIKKEIPLHIILNKFDIYTRQVEQYSPLDYVLKYQLYYKAGNMNNAYANAILAYCAIARGELTYTNREFLSFDKFLKSSPYYGLYRVLNNAYNLFNINEYDKCYNNLNNYLKDNHIINGTSIFFSIYIPEFICEIIYLRGMCICRLQNRENELIFEQQKLLQILIQAINLSTRNKELILRLCEQKLLLKTYSSMQSRKKQKEIYDEYFSICNQYQTYIRDSTIRTREKWEIRYASFLLKANIISEIPDKLIILEKGYNIIYNSKNLYPEKYLKAACNIAGDYMWRNQIDRGHQILKKAVDFIEAHNWLPYWGVVYQMYIFSRLYGNTDDSPNDLFEEYSKKVWNIPEIRSKMHEMAICSSNYAILLASVGKLDEANNLLQKTINDITEVDKYSLYLLSTNLGMIKYLLGDTQNAIELESYCKKMIEDNLVPTFSYAFINKRSSVLLDIYSQKKSVDNVLKILTKTSILSTGYYSDNYFRPLLFSDINYWAD